MKSNIMNHAGVTYRGGQSGWQADKMYSCDTRICTQVVVSVRQTNTLWLSLVKDIYSLCDSNLI